MWRKGRGNKEASEPMVHSDSGCIPSSRGKKRQERERKRCSGREREWEDDGRRVRCGE